MQTLPLSVTIELPQIIQPLRGLPFNPNESRWSFNDGVTAFSLNFNRISALSCGLINHIKMVLIWYAENTSGGQLVSHFQKLILLLEYIHQAQHGLVTSISSSDLINYRDHLGKQKEWYLGSLASFLKKWHEFKLPGIADEAMEFFNQVKLKGVEKGKAVRTMDPETGPFTDIELEAIRDAVNRRYSIGGILKSDYLLIWLLLLLGQRVRQYALLKVKDVVRVKKADGSFEYIISIPRIKQQSSKLRDEFKERVLTPSFGELLFEYARSLEKKFTGLVNVPSNAPLFPAKSIRKNQPEEFYFHESPELLAFKVKSVIRSLEVFSERTGKTLHITTKRFRYTTGTRAIKEGHGELIIAELLDHSDTQNVQVYTEYAIEVVERIDKAVALRMAPLAKAFSGEIIQKESEALRGHDPTSRIVDPKIDTKMKPMGNCARTGYCGFIAPIACYTCNNFQAWVDGPHEKVLDYLLAERARLLEMADERIASINDRTILAVSDVVIECKKMRGSENG